MNWKQLRRENILFLVIDVQENFFKIIDKTIVANARQNLLLLTRMFAKMGIPMIGTEHCAAKIGPTDAALLADWKGPAFTDKVSFSCCGSEAFLKNLNEHHRPVVVVTGLETQICVLQTVLDLIDRKYTVIVLKDAVLSSTKLKWQNGLDLMEKAGAHILNTETLLFYVLQRAEGDDFKALVKLLKAAQ